MPRDGAATRTRILDAAERLIIENGFAATSVDQVLAAAGTSKGAFFHHFDSKLALAEALVQRYAVADVGQLETALEATAAIPDPADRVVAFVRFFEEGYQETLSAQSNCLYVAALTERQLVETGTTEEILRAVTTWRERVSALLDAAVDDRGLDTAVDTAALADHLFVTFEGAFLLCRLTGSPEPMRDQLRTYRLLVASLLGVSSEAGDSSGSSDSPGSSGSSGPSGSGGA